MAPKSGSMRDYEGRVGDAMTLKEECRYTGGVFLFCVMIKYRIQELSIFLTKPMMVFRYGFLVGTQVLFTDIDLIKFGLPDRVPESCYGWESYS